METCFAKTTNDVKGDGSVHDKYQQTYNPEKHHNHLSQALGGTSQDIGCEGAMAAIMNIPPFLGFRVGNPLALVQKTF